MQRENGDAGRPRTKGRFAKKPAAGADAGGLGSSGELGELLGAGAGDLAPPDRPGLAAVESLADLEREAVNIAAVAPVEASEPVPAGPGLGPVPAPIAGPTEEEILAGYNMVCGELIDSGCNALLPAWQVKPAEVSKLSTACSKALMLWFPDMIIPPKYLALLTIAGVAFEIAQARKDPNTGAYLPARVPDRAPPIDQAATAPAH